VNRFLPIIKRGLVVILTVFAIVYVGDFVWFRIRLHNAKPGDPLQVLKIEGLYAIPQKNGRVEYTPADPVDVTCVRSIFPHAGYDPCWYVARQNGKPIPMLILLRFRWIASGPEERCSLTTLE
jgi:hypothetical protein